MSGIIGAYPYTVKLTEALLYKAGVEAGHIEKDPAYEEMLEKSGFNKMYNMGRTKRQ